MVFVALETGLKTDDFQGDYGVIPDPETELVEGKLVPFLGTPNHLQ